MSNSRSIILTISSMMLSAGCSSNNHSKLGSFASNYVAAGILEGHKGAPAAIKFNPTLPAQAISAGGDGRIIGWDLSTKNSAWTSKYQSRWNELTFTSDGLFLGAAGNREGLVLLHSATGKLIRNFAGQAGNIEAIAFSPDGKLMATGSTDATIMIWDTESGKDLHLIANRDGWIVTSLRFSSDGKFLFAGAIESLRVWSVESRQMIKEFPLGNYWIDDIAISPDSRYAALTGNENNEIVILSTESGKILRTLKGHEHSVRSVSFTGDMQQLISASLYSVRIWDVASGEENARIPAKTGEFVTATTHSKDDYILLIGGLRNIAIWRNAND